MRVVFKPNISPVRTYVRCYSSFRSPTRINFRNITRFISLQSLDYDQRAINKNLFTFLPIIQSPASPNPPVSSNINKNDMVKLYNKKMVGHHTGRKIYDKLMALPKLNKCPFCGIGTVRNLDHYLPESKFPTFSVLPYNLVASCKECNEDKSADYATTQNLQTLHPYYDNFTREQWLFARVLNTSPISVEFYVNAPSAWSQVNKDRVESHFNNYNLSKRFSIEASTVLANLRYKFTQYIYSPIDISNELEKEYTVHSNLHLNSWETAMYQALYSNPWYTNGGYI